MVLARRCRAGAAEESERKRKLLKCFGILLLVGRSLGGKTIRESLANKRKKGVIYEAECRVICYS